MKEPTDEELLSGILSKLDNSSNLVDHARRELELAGLFKEESDYGGMIGNAVYDLVRLFARQGHSGMSASWTAELAFKLFNYETLTENDHSEFIDRTEETGRPMLQCKRDPSYFSEDNGQTWYSLNES